MQIVDQNDRLNSTMGTAGKFVAQVRYEFMARHTATSGRAYGRRQIRKSHVFIHACDIQCDCLFAQSLNFFPEPHQSSCSTASVESANYAKGFADFNQVEQATDRFQMDTTVEKPGSLPLLTEHSQHSSTKQIYHNNAPIREIGRNGVTDSVKFVQSPPDSGLAIRNSAVPCHSGDLTGESAGRAIRQLCFSLHAFLV